MNEMKLAAGKRRRLPNQLRYTSDARQFRRLLAVLAHDRGEPVSRIAELLGVNRQSVYNWIERACQPGDLLDAPRPGRPAKAGEAFDTLLRVLLILPPQRFGYHAYGWTVPLLQDQLKKNMGEEYSATTVRRGLQRLDYVWKRPRYVLVPDSEREKKREILLALRRMPKRGVLLVEDETDLQLFPPLRAMWWQKGEPARVLLSGCNERRVVFGCMNLVSGHRLFLARTRQRAEDFQAFLREVHGHYRGWDVTMLLDGDTSHTAKGSQDLARQLGIRLRWLPKRSPELNPMESLWGQSQGRHLRQLAIRHDEWTSQSIRRAFKWPVESGSIANIGRLVGEFLVETSFVKKFWQGA